MILVSFRTNIFSSFDCIENSNSAIVLICFIIHTFVENEIPLLKSKQCDSQCNDDIGWKTTLCGIILCLFSAFLLLVNNAILKKTELDSIDAFLISALIQVIVSVLIICKNGSKLWIWEFEILENIFKIRILFLICPFFASIGYISDIIAVSSMPIGDAMAIIFSCALPTVLMAAIFLNERLRLCKIVCCVLLVSGIIMVIRPPFIFGDDVGPLHSKDILKANESPLNKKNKVFKNERRNLSINGQIL